MGARSGFTEFPSDSPKSLPDIKKLDPRFARITFPPKYFPVIMGFPFFTWISTRGLEFITHFFSMQRCNPFSFLKREMSNGRGGGEFAKSNLFIVCIESKHLIYLMCKRKKGFWDDDKKKKKQRKGFFAITSLNPFLKNHSFKRASIF